MNNKEFIKELCILGAEKKQIDLTDKKYKDRLNMELDVICGNDLEDYFLNNSFIINSLKDDGIFFGPARGCLKSNSNILTKNGFKEIKDIQKGDMVLSKDGKYHKVTKTFKYKNEDKLIKINSYFSSYDGISLTKDHKVLACFNDYDNKYKYRIEKGYSEKSIKSIKKYSNKISQPTWIEAEKLNENHLLVIPKFKKISENKVIDIVKYIDDSKFEYDDNYIYETLNHNQFVPKRKIKIKRFINVNYELGYLLGWFSADGWIESNNKNITALCCNKKEDDGCIIDIFSNIFDISDNFRKENRQNMVVYRFSSKVIRSFFKNLNPNYDFSAQTKILYGKTLSNDYIFKKGLYDGAMCGDGYTPDVGKWQYTSVSKNLIEDFKELCIILNIPAKLRFSKRINNRKDFSKKKYFENYDIEMPNPNSLKKYVWKEDDKYIYVRFRGLKEVKAEEYVYDISVDGEQNYMTDSFIVHNSSAGSLIAYILNITTVNPLLYNLSFSRFLNKSRVEKGELPDQDIDIQQSKRKEAINFIKEEYGKDKVFGLTNFNTYSLKVAIKDISRVFGIDFGKVNNITKQITNDTNIENIEQIPVIKSFFEQYPQVKEYLPVIYSLNKTHGRHAGAIVLFPEPIENYMGTNKIKDDICTCYDKKLEGRGFLKLDLLGLKTLDIISDTLKLAKVKLPKPKDFNDKKVFETINKSPLGVFQLEENAGVKYLSETKIDTFEDLYNALALIRPGSRDTGDTDRYIERKKDPTKIEYDHSDLESVLGETLGIIVFQEQQMGIAQTIAGFDEVKADDLRKAIGKKKLDLMESLKEDFISGGLSLKYDLELLELLWSKIEAAGNYSFNKSHAVGYAFISYYCGWLKTYYPAEFLISVANHSNDEKRVKVFNEIKNLGIKVLNPSVNKSETDITMSNGKIILGLRQIDGIGDKAIESIISKRPYISFDDFMMKRTPRQVNVKVVKALIEAGGFDEFNNKRDDLYYNVSDEEYHKWTTQEKLLREYKKLKLSPSQNLIDYYKDEIKGIKVYSLDNLPEEDMDEFYIQGLVNSFVIKDAFNVLEISDGKDIVSLFVDDIVKSKYFKVLNSVGVPLLIKCSQYNGNLGLSFLIDLTEKDKYEKQLNYIKGNFNFDKGYVIKKLRYFKSKAKGTPCVRLDVIGKKGDEGLISCVSGYNRRIPNMEAGDMIVFKRSGDFVSNIKVIK